MNIVTKRINSILAEALQHRIFKALVKDLEVEYEDLILTAHRLDRSVEEKSFKFSRFHGRENVVAEVQR